MSTEHIVDLLDNSPVSQLDSSRLSSIRAHIGSCEPCRQACEASLISVALVRERAAEEIHPSPFFKTRVMAALRERQGAGLTRLAGFTGLWKTARAAISAMILVTAILLSLTFLSGSPATDSSSAQGMAQMYSMEQVFEDNPQSPNESVDATSGQVLDAVFAGEDAYGSSQ